jgi:hypothetical protein
VYCKAGMAEVTRIFVKTGDGSRLLELRLLDRTSPPFHAAASNILVEPASDGETETVHLPPDGGWLI